MANTIELQDFNARLRAIEQTTDHLVQLQMLADLMAATVAASSDMTNIQNAVTTEVTRRKALPANQRHGGF
jgi:hypothetical protein